MKNTTKQEKKQDNKVFKTIKKPNNAIEVEIQKSPGKTVLGKIVAWSIALLTIFAPLAALIYYIIIASK